MAWNEQRIAQLKALWAEGNSAKYIAEVMGGVTRNAVIGKIHRLGVAQRDAGFKQRATSRKKKRGDGVFILNRINAKRVQPMPESIAPPEFLALELFDLRAGHCRYPRGEEAPYLFCGQPVKDGSSYCEYCYSLTHATVRNPRPPHRGFVGFRFGEHAA